MPRLHLVRHGEAMAGFGGHADPGLSDLGRAQAEKTAERLSSLIPVKILSSPLARARETASSLERRWNRKAEIRPAIGEIVSPTEDLAERTEWLRGIMDHDWADLDEIRQVWRDGVVSALLEIAEDSIVFSHFIAINVAMGAALNERRVTCFHPDYASVTVFDSDRYRLALVEKGAERATKVR